MRKPLKLDAAKTNEVACGLRLHTHLLLTGNTPGFVAKYLNEKMLGEHLLEMVDLIGMQVWTPAQVAYSDRPGNTGFMGIVGITTSHIAFHHWDCAEPGVLQFDVFSCRQFDHVAVVDEIARKWHCQLTQAHLLTRYPKIEMRDLLGEVCD